MHTGHEEDMTDVIAKTETFGGVRAETENTFDLRPGEGHVEMGSKTDLFAGVESKLAGTLRISGLELTTEAKGQLGAGYSYTAHVDATPQHGWTLEGGASAAEGVGAGIKGKVKVDIDRVKTDFAKLADIAQPSGPYDAGGGQGW
jgi:hypothetical protein